MIFRVTTEGEPIRHIHFCFDAEGLDTFLTDLSSEHFWWPYLDASEEETAYWRNTPQHIGRLDVFMDDGSFPALQEYPLAVIIEADDERPCERLTLIGTREAFEKHLHAPIRHMLRHGKAGTEIPLASGRSLTLDIELQKA